MLQLLKRDLVQFYIVLSLFLKGDKILKKIFKFFLLANICISIIVGTVFLDFKKASAVAIVPGAIWGIGEIGLSLFGAFGMKIGVDKAYKSSGVVMQDVQTVLQDFRSFLLKGGGFLCLSEQAVDRQVREFENAILNAQTTGYLKLIKGGKDDKPPKKNKSLIDTIKAYVVTRQVVEQSRIKRNYKYITEPYLNVKPSFGLYNKNNPNDQNGKYGSHFYNDIYQGPGFDYFAIDDSLYPNSSKAVMDFQTNISNMANSDFYIYGIRIEDSPGTATYQNTIKEYDGMPYSECGDTTGVVQLLFPLADVQFNSEFPSTELKCKVLTSVNGIAVNCEDLTLTNLGMTNDMYDWVSWRIKTNTTGAVNPTTLPRLNTYGDITFTDDIKKLIARDGSLANLEVASKKSNYVQNKDIKGDLVIEVPMTYPAEMPLSQGATNLNLEPIVHIDTHTNTDANTQKAVEEAIPNKPPPSGGDDGAAAEKIKKKTKGLHTLFPFCIPFDLIDAFKLLQAKPECPKWEFDWKIPSINFSHHFVIDFAVFNTLIFIFNKGILILYIVSMILLTRNIIRG